MTSTTRRAPLGVTAAAFPVAGDRASAIDYDAIRQRVALVCETFTRSTAGFPEAMTAEEAAAAQAWTDDEINAGDAFIDFAVRWGVSLDWLVAGDIKALIHYARHGLARSDTAA